MSQWIKRFPIKPIYFCLLIVCLYFTIHHLSVLSFLVLSYFIIQLFRNYARKVCCLIFILLAVFACLFYGHKSLTKQNFEKEHPLIKRITLLPDTIKINGDSLSFRGKSGKETYQVFYKLKSEKEKINFQHLSDLIEIEIEGKVSFAEEQRNFSGFNYQSYLQTQSIYRIINIDKINSIQAISSRNPMDWLSILRRKALVFIKNEFPKPMNQYMTGLLFGHLDSDFADMNELYSSLGIIHLFALSGMQVGFFMDGFRKILLRLGLTSETVTKIQLPFTFFYIGLTGFSISVIRSVIQKIVSQYGLVKLDNFSITIILLSILVPNFLLTIGGVLSCAYTFIIAMIDFEHLPTMRKCLAESFTISLGILPILIFYFGEFQPWSILLTFLFSFLFDLFMLPLLTIVFLLSPFFIFHQVNVLFEILEDSILWCSEFFPPPFILGQPPLWIVLTILLILAVLYDFRWNKQLATSFSFLVILLFFLGKHPLENEVTIVDIGQGDSIFLRDWTGKTILIDVGGRLEINQKENWQKQTHPSNAEKTLIPYLKSRGVNHIDTLVLTHTDTDHMGDMLEVAKTFKISQVLISEGSLTNPVFVNKLKNMNTKINTAHVGDKIPIMDGFLQVLYPSEKGDGSNNDSIVLYGNLLNTRFLFTGDLEMEGENSLLKMYPHLTVDVLKAGHHGSKGSSSLEFLSAIRPKMVLISAGKNNRYKHPHQETLDRISQIGSTIYRTDQQGAIRFIGWNTWSIETVR